MKASLLLSIIFSASMLILPNAAFSARQITVEVSEACKTCWGDLSNSGNCESQCSSSCDSSLDAGNVDGSTPSCTDLTELMKQYRWRTGTCNDSKEKMATYCPSEYNSAVGFLDLAAKSHKKCESADLHIRNFTALNCQSAYNACRNVSCAATTSDYVAGDITFYVSRMAAHSTDILENGCQATWRSTGFEELFTKYEEKRDLARNECGATPPQPPGPGDDDPIVPEPVPDTPRREEPKKDNKNPVTQGMNTLGQLSQMVQPFLAQQNTGVGVDYSGNYRPAQPQAPVVYPSSFDSPNYFNTGAPAGGNFDEPFLGGGNTQNTNNNRNDFNQNNNQGQQGMMMGAGMMGGGMMGQQGGNNNAAPRGRAGGRRAKKKDKTLYSNKAEEQGAAGAYATPGESTKQVARKVGFDKNGQQIDQNFDPSKYSPKINDVYKRAINSDAMNKAMRRAAGFETQNTDNSRGYTSWHKTHNIHPGQLSIFKQMRICYIMKYSSSVGSCGNNSNN